MIEEQNDVLDSRIKLHDRHRFEVKLDIDLEDADRGAYSVETYFFIPRALNVGPHNYTKDNFYNSSQRYIRFSTPKIGLGRLCDPGLETSPLNRVRKLLSRVLAAETSHGLADELCDELRLLGCVIRGEIRDYVRIFADGLGSYADGAPAAQRKLFLGEGMENFFADMRNLETALRSLRGEITDPAVPVKIRETAAFFDEYVSLIIEEYLASLLEALRAAGPAARERFAEVEREAVQMATAQNLYRQAMKYPSVLVPGSTNEVIIYRRGVLKKFMSGVLFLKAEFSEWETLTQVVFGLAAGAAMLFAGLVMMYFQNRYTMNSMPFVLALVVSYMFKDRIKDWLKLSFSRNLTRWISDRKIEIKDIDTGGTIGMLKEGVTFINDKALPPDISRVRHIDNITSVDEAGKPERVLKYKKEIELYPDKVQRHRERHRGLNDIMRFNIREVIAQADDATVDYPYVDPETGAVRSVACARVYHMNLVLKYSYTNRSGQPAVNFERIRIVLSKDGITRLEEVKLV